MSPAANDLMLLAGFAFVANFAVTFQDVGIDSLMIDMMPEEERARASGFMFGAQVIGISAATALGGALFKILALGPAWSQPLRSRHSCCFTAFLSAKERASVACLGALARRILTAS